MKFTKLLILTALILGGLISALGLRITQAAPAHRSDSGLSLLDSFLKSDPGGLGYLFDRNGSPNPDDNLAPTAAGDIDPTFTGGVTNTGFSNGQTVQAIVIQPDGKHLIAGNFSMVNSTGRNYIVRLNPDGTVDPTFDTGLGFNGVVDNLKVQPDGKILAVGTFTSFTDSTGVNNKGRIARLNSDGTLDPNFSLGTGANAEVRTLDLQADGKIIIGGDFTAVDGSTRARIARLNADGAVDLSFTQTTGYNSSVYAVKLQSDGKVLVGGAYTLYNGTAVNYISRLNSNGSLDATFTTGTGANGSVSVIALQPDGKIILGGGFVQFNGAGAQFIARLNSNGTRDSFVEGSCAQGQTNCFNISNPGVGGLTVMPNGQIYVSGRGWNPGGGWTNHLIRLNSDGARDFGFQEPFSSFDNGEIPSRHAVQADGAIVTATGRIVPGATTIFSSMRRINPDGSEDGLYTPIIGYLANVNKLFLQPDGKLVAGGNFNIANTTQRLNLARFNADGSLDTTFNARTDNRVYDIVRQPDGKFIIVGQFTSVNGTNRGRVARINANGTLDSTFNAQIGADGDVYTAVLQADGKIIIVGRFNNYSGVGRSKIARINPDGSIDTTFNPGTGFSNDAFIVRLQTDGKIVVSGSFDAFNSIARNRIARLNPDGSLDTSFNPGTGANSFVNGMQIAPDGKILIGGTFNSYNNVSRLRIARVNADGSLDTTFNAANTTAPDNWVHDFYVQTDGKIIIGGNFNSVMGQVRRGIARLNSDGTLDNTFANNMEGALPTANDWTGLAVDETAGKLYYGGAFTTFNNVGRGALVRLFTGAPQTYSISGNITRSGSALSGVAVALTGASSSNTTTDAAGNYSFTGLTAGGSYTVTPTLANNTFTPASASFNNLAANQTANFTAALNCTYSLSPVSPQTVAPTAGTLNVTVTAPAGCAWTAASNSAFLSVTGGASGSGNGTVNISIAANSGAARSGTLTIAGQTYTINQQDGTVNCTYLLSPTSASVAATAGSGTFSVTTQAGCAWTAQSSSSFLTSSSTGSGSGTVNYAYQANAGTARVGTITVGGQIFTLNQASGGACQNCVTVSLPNTNASQNTTITVPVTVGDTTGRNITAFDFDLRFDSTIVRPLAAQPVDNAGTISSNFTITPNAGTTGRLVVSAFGINPLSGAGTLLNLKFEVIGNPQQAAALNWQTFLFNEGDPQASTSPGQITVVNGSIAGTINYYFVPTGGTPKAMANVTVTGAGTPQVSAATNTAGAYLLNNFGAGAYTVTPSKTGDVNGISSLDASRVAQFVAGLVTLTANQQIAADTTNNGSVSSLDASRLAQYVAGIPNTGITGQWKFAPASRSYASVTTQLTGENYDAVLVGEVTGNWTAPAVFGEKDQPETKTETVEARSENALPPVTVSLPTQNVQPGTTVTIPITVGDTTGQNITAYDFDLRFDPNIIQPVAGNPASNAGTLSSNFTITPNPNTPGKLVVSAFGIAPLAGSGILLNLNFQVVGQSGSSPLTWQMFTFNEGDPMSSMTNGSVTIPSACTYALSPSSANAGVTGGAGSFTVTTQTGCAWTASGNAAWLTTSSAGSGSGTVNYTVAANNGAARSATITVVGQTFTVNQEALVVQHRAPFDFDGDSKTDVSIFRPSDGSWWYLRSSDAGFRVYRFGVSTDKLVPGDYTGDGKADIAVFRDGTWFIQRSEDNSFFSFPFGTSGDIPAPGDYDGDGKTDAAVFRPSTATWFILNSNGSGTTIVPFGSSEDRPVTADYDGDGKADIAIFRPSDGSWWYLRSSDGQFRVFRFGAGTDKPVPGDYTGDGKAELAVFRPSTGEWFFQRSEDNSYYSFVWGANGDMAAPGDYDGDGKFDASVFRPSNATWYLNQTTSGVGIVTFGSSSDIAVPNAFVR